MTGADRDLLATIANYQFGREAGEALFPAGESRHITRSAAGRPRQVTVDGERLVTLRTNGRFTLGLEGGRRLAEGLAFPAYRVVVGDESEPFVRDGKNVFNKFVRTVDPDVRGGDEVVVETNGGEVIGVGRAWIHADGMADFETGMAVKIREGAGVE
jgi:uncharacterized protein with predicted RNA binding PUA domain